MRKLINANQEDIIIVSTGRIEVEKGFKVIKNIIKQTSELNNLKFVIVGNGNYLNEMKTELKKEVMGKKVHFLGYRSEVYSILNDSDIFLLPSYHETLCMSLAEARMNGLILLGSNVGGIPEIIENDVNGFLLDVNDVNGYVKLISKISSSPQYFNKLKVQSKQMDNNKFSTVDIIAKVDRLYKEML